MKHTLLAAVLATAIAAPAAADPTLVVRLDPASGQLEGSTSFPKARPTSTG